MENGVFCYFCRMAKKQPPKDEEQLKAISLKLFPSMIDDVDEIRKAQGGVSRNAWIRQAIVEKINKHRQED